MYHDQNDLQSIIWSDDVDLGTPKAFELELTNGPEKAKVASNRRALTRTENFMAIAR